MAARRDGTGVRGAAIAVKAGRRRRVLPFDRAISNRLDFPVESDVGPGNRSSHRFDQLPAVQGSITARPPAAKALVSRDATTKPCAAAIAAM